MLEAADIGVIIKAPGDYVLEAKDMLLSKEIGPRGWAEMMTQILDRLQIPQSTTNNG
jgi:hypothetical protein